MDLRSDWIWIMVSVVMGLCLILEIAGFVARIRGL